MQILFQVSSLKCLLAYQRTAQKEVPDKLDEKLFELAARLSALISSEPYTISINANTKNDDLISKSIHTCKKMNIILRGFDKIIGGKITGEETIPISICFDAIIDKEIIDKIFCEDQYVILDHDTFGLLYSLV